MKNLTRTLSVELLRLLAIVNSSISYLDQFRMNESNDASKVVVIADATSPAVQECANVFARRGAKLVLNYPPESHLTPSLPPKQNVAESQPPAHMESHEKFQNMGAVIAKAVKSFGTVDVLICDCSFRSPTPSYDLMSSSSWDIMRTRVIDGAYRVNLFTTPKHLRPANVVSVLKQCESIFANKVPGKYFS